MCEFLFRVRDHSSAARLGKGDCVAVVPNGWTWTQIELTNPDWRIVKVPDMSLAEAEEYLSADLGDSALGYLPQPRKYKIDQTRFVNPATAAFVADDSRTQPYLMATAAALRNVLVLRPPLIDPNFIGE